MKIAHRPRHCEPAPVDQPPEPSFPPCPLLPPPHPRMDYRRLRALRNGPPEDLLTEALTYGHYLWQRALPARAILALARGLYCDAPPTAVTTLPYHPLAWMMRHYDPQTNAFIGNPRLSFQHQALRLRGPRHQQRRARAWAINAIARTTLPHLPPDPTITTPEPTPEQIATLLTHTGLPGEATLFLQALTHPH